MPKESPSQQIDELKTILYTYITLGPLVSALFASRIDNIFAACFLFVCLNGAAFLWVKTRLEMLEQSVREQEERVAELSQALELREVRKGESC
jgi:hypothetical protein